MTAGSFCCKVQSNYYVCRKAEMHENRWFFSTGVEFPKNALAYVSWVVVNRTFVSSVSSIAYDQLLSTGLDRVPRIECMQTAMFAITLARAMTCTYHDVKLRPLAFSWQVCSVPKCYFIYFNYNLLIKSGFCWYFIETITSKFNKININIPEHRKRCIIRPSWTFQKAIIIWYFSKRNALKKPSERQILIFS